MSAPASTDLPVVRAFRADLTKPCDPRYLQPRTTYRVVAADGSILNWGWPSQEVADRDAARHEGATVVRYDYLIEVDASTKVLIDSGIPEQHWPEVRSEAHLAMNMTMDAGRPSDAMRSAVRMWKADNENR